MFTSKSKVRLSALSALLCLSLLSFSGCTRLLYHPSDIMYVQNPKVLDGMRKEVFFPSSDGVKLAGWFFKSAHRGHKGVVVQFHGNAQNMTSHFASLVWLRDEGYDFFTFDYRGYGISEGHPTEEGVNHDALAAIRYIIKREKVPADGKPDVVLYGQSLGSAILMRAFEDLSGAERARIKAVVVEGSFYNYHEIARDVLSRSWITYIFQPLAYVLVSNEYGPQDAIAKISPTPLLVIHGESDPVIPFAFGEKVFALAKEPKEFLPIPGGKHIDAMFIDQGRYRANLLEFLGKY